jgi:hypothetical protein
MVEDAGYISPTGDTGSSISYHLCAIQYVMREDIAAEMDTDTATVTNDDFSGIITVIKLRDPVIRWLPPHEFWREFYRFQGTGIQMQIPLLIGPGEPPVQQKDGVTTYLFRKFLQIPQRIFSGQI